MGDTSTKWLIVGAIALAGIGLAARHVGQQKGASVNRGKYKGWEWRVSLAESYQAWRSQVRSPGGQWEDVAVYRFDGSSEKKTQRMNAIEGAKNAIDAEVSN